jgi:hypothetical protein
MTKSKWSACQILTTKNKEDKKKNNQQVTICMNQKLGIKLC